MKARLLILFIGLFVSQALIAGTGIGTNEFYRVLSSSSSNEVKTALNKLPESKLSSKQRIYRGALMIKQAEFETNVKRKLTLSKEGIAIIEAEIQKNPSNIEYRFIRLTIQENIPPILKYRKNIQEDKQKIIGGFKRQPETLKTIIRNYAKQSRFLDSRDLN